MIDRQWARRSIVKRETTKIRS